MHHVLERGEDVVVLVLVVRGLNLTSRQGRIPRREKDHDERAHVGKRHASVLGDDGSGGVVSTCLPVAYLQPRTVVPRVTGCTPAPEADLWRVGLWKDEATGFGQ